MFRKGSSKKKTSIDYKARLERKLCVARESPEPVFDLSDCNLKQVPNNIFSLCRVFRKDALLLQDNHLFNLSQGGSLNELMNLKVLNINSNEFTELPNSISCLQSLEVLDVSNNKLIKLPLELGDLKKLKFLNLSLNNLKTLPITIGNCENLEELNVLCNEALKEIPISLGKLKRLQTLEVGAAIVYPPQEICREGIHSILTFMQKELLKKEGMEDPLTSIDGSLSGEQNFTSSVQKTNQSDCLAKEQKLAAINLKNLNLNCEKQQEAKQKLLDDIKSEQKALDKKLCQVQSQKKADRALLIRFCQAEEKESCDAIKRILGNNRKLRSDTLDVYEKERREEEEKLIYNALMSNLNKPSERHRILVSMDETMREEIKKYQVTSQKKRLGAFKSLSAEITFESDSLKELIRKSDNNKKELVDSILADEELQKSAVVSLLEKNDAVSWEFAQQISLLETKLIELTRLELLKRRVESDRQMVELSKNRMELTRVLMDLFEKQTARRKELTNKIRQMEAKKEEKKFKNHYWLEQYNLLLHSKSSQMVKYMESVHPNLVYNLFLHGVFHYLPLMKEFALDERKLDQLNYQTLSEVGIKDEEDKSNVLKAVRNFLSEERSHRERPSAPDLTEPSAPLSFSRIDLMEYEFTGYPPQEECVICLDLKPTLIFVPCGHACTCYDCSVPVILCPICRQPIAEKREILYPRYWK